MKQEAAANAEKDKKEKESVEKINKGDTLAFQIEKVLKESKDGITQEEKEKLEKQIANLKAAIKEKKIDEVGKLTEELEKMWHPIAMKIYSAKAKKEQAKKESDKNSGSEKKEEPNVKDAEFEEVDSDK